jgi:ketosteroid isomerase-like protein
VELGAAERRLLGALWASRAVGTLGDLDRRCGSVVVRLKRAAGLTGWVQRARVAYAVPSPEEDAVSENLERLKQAYDVYARGGPPVTEEWPDDFVLEGYDAEGLPLSGVHKGKEAVLRALDAVVASYDEFRFAPDEFLEQGDTIVVLAHLDVRKGDRSSKLPAVHVWRFENGQPRRQQVLTDTLAVARLLGVV